MDKLIGGCKGIRKQTSRGDFTQITSGVVFAIIFLSAGVLHAAGKPPKPPATPINPAIVYMAYGGPSGFGTLAIANADGTGGKCERQFFS